MRRHRRLQGPQSSGDGRGTVGDMRQSREAQRGRAQGNDVAGMTSYGDRLAPGAETCDQRQRGEHGGRDGVGLVRLYRRGDRQACRVGAVQ